MGIKLEVLFLLELMMISKKKCLQSLVIMIIIPLVTKLEKMQMLDIILRIMLLNGIFK